MTEIASGLELAVSTTHRRLRQLRDLGLVWWDDQSRRELRVTELGYAALELNKGKWGHFRPARKRAPQRKASVQ